VEIARRLAPQIPEKNFIIEPEKRDTAPAMGLVAAKLFNESPDEPIAFIPSDHFISDKQKFVRILKKAEELIRETGKLLDIAVSPSFPSTVLGYTRIGNLFVSDEGVEVFEFLGHKEKPDFETAQKYLLAGDYLWHANYYMWTPKLILEAFNRYSPAHGAELQKIGAAVKVDDREALAEAFRRMEKISFDYAVTEKIDPRDVLIVKGEFGWSDVGAFDMLYDSQKAKADADKNVWNGDWRGHDTSGCLIYGRPDKVIATVGVDDLVIVDTPDALLICPKSRSQDVKKIVEILKAENKFKHL
jgi:mannose-1-phosphate guanylyltransferase